jgi:UDP-GlcNAc:undecaprenyl-phosphate GlcNAc-1-phosphate transferase
VLAVLGVLASRYGGETLSVLLVPMLLFGILFDVVFTLLRRALAGENITQAHRSHLYQLAQRAGLPAWAVTLVHWGMVAIGGLICIGFTAAHGPLKPLIPLCVLVPQLAWLAVVMRQKRQAGLKTW